VAEAFRGAGHDVTLLSGADSLRPPESATVRCVTFTSASSLLELLLGELAAPDAPDVLVHAAAVADYAPEIEAGKITSNREELVLRMHPTPKVVDEVRRRHPGLAIILFKLESRVTHAVLRARARATLERVDASVIVANLLEEVSVDDHVAEILRWDGTHERVRGRLEIARSIVREAESIVARRSNAPNDTGSGPKWPTQ